MASSPRKTSKLFARDIIAFSDEGLDQYLKVNGGFVQAQDPENLMKDEGFIERLRARTGSSHTIDLNYVSTRLEEVPTDREISRQSSTTPSINEEEDYRRNLKEQTNYYNKLREAGGRPSHPVSLGREILTNPKYHEILSYWQLVNGDAEGNIWEVFGSQLADWLGFLEHRRSARKQGRFSTYCQQLRDRLVKRQFEQSFEPCEEVSQQDEMATWIEFLDYKYCLYDETARFMSSHQHRRDEAWHRLVGSKVLQPDETEESLDGWLSHQLQKDEIDARNNMKSAEKDLLTAKCSGLSERNTPRMEIKVSAAESKLATTATSLILASKRRKLIRDFMKQTRSYRIAKNNKTRQSILLRWILEEIPLIQSELSAANGARDGTNMENGRRRGLKRSRGNDLNEEREERVSKRRPGISCIFPSKPTRTLRASKATIMKSDSEKFKVVLDESTRVRKLIQPVRQSCREKRPPKWFRDI